MTIESYEQKRKRQSEAELAEKYGAIGPAAILAALAAKAREQDEKQKRSANRAA